MTKSLIKLIDTSPEVSFGREIPIPTPKVRIKQAWDVVKF